MRSLRGAMAFGLVLAACTGTAGPTTSTPPPTTSTTVPPTTAPATSVAPDSGTTTSTPGPPPAHRIGVRTTEGLGEFYDTLTGEPFVVRGANYVFVQGPGGSWSNEPFSTVIYDAERTRQDFTAIADAGFTTVRMFFDQCSSPPGCITDPARPGLDPSYLDNIVEVLDLAAETGLYLLLTSNDIPDFGGYGDAANRDAGDQMAGYRNAHYLTAAGHQAAVDYWDDFMSGLVERGARFDHVLGWSLLNEQWLFGGQPPLSLREGEVTTADDLTYDLADPEARLQMVRSNLLEYAHRVHDVIESHDPTALVTMGFFSPQFPNPTGIGGSWHVDTVGYIAGNAPFDFYDFHAYAGEDLTLTQMAENFGVALLDDKPVVMGEHGAFIHRYPTLQAATRAISGWIVESCELGFDGWIYWSYRTNPDVDDKTWSLTSENGSLFDLLAPRNRPDPCAPIPVETSNLAFGAVVRASRSLADQPPEAAVDEDATTQWGAGDSPQQWIEVELNQPSEVGEIRLLVSQYPAGATVHRVLVDRGSGLEEVHVFSGDTEDLGWLIFSPQTPLVGVTRVRVQTVSSPSWVAWREIEINVP